MTGASAALQKALYGALSADAALMAAVTGIYDGVRAGAALPYVTIGPDTVTDAGWKGGTAFDHRVTVTVWATGPGAAGTKALMALVSAAVVAVADASDGWRIAWLSVQRSSLTIAAEGATQGRLELIGRTCRFPD